MRISAMREWACSWPACSAAKRTSGSSDVALSERISMSGFGGSDMFLEKGLGERSSSVVGSQEG